MKRVLKSQLRLQGEVEAEKEVARLAHPLGKSAIREMRDRDPHYDRLDAGIDRRN